MKSVVICGNHIANESSYCAIDTIDLEGIPITVGHNDTQEPIVDWDAHENQYAVLLKIRAFSCNYRDKAFILGFYQEYHELPSYTSIGSEFAAEVMAIGPLVTRFRVGDRVMGDNHYAAMNTLKVMPGVAANSSSRRFRILPEAKLIALPVEMSDEVAAAFSIGAQTSYSIVRKLDLQPGAHVLLTGGTSNTSLFLLQALRLAGAVVTVTTTSDRRHEDLRRMGAQEVLVVDPTVPSFLTYPAIDAVMQLGGFAAVVDLFYDLYLHKSIEVLAMDGTYITCGFADQYSRITGKHLSTESRPLKRLMANIILRNLHLVGNCIGHTDDLRRAIADYQAGNLVVPIDSVFHGDQIAAFFQRTYTAPQRFGKVIYSYDD